MEIRPAEISDILKKQIAAFDTEQNVAETVMTGLLGGGHAIYLDAPSGTARNLDCFCAAPGLGVPPREAAELLRLEVPFGEELVHYAVGPASEEGRDLHITTEGLGNYSAWVTGVRRVDAPTRRVLDVIAAAPAHDDMAVTAAAELHRQLREQREAMLLDRETWSLALRDPRFLGTLALSLTAGRGQKGLYRVLQLGMGALRLGTPAR